HRSSKSPRIKNGLSRPRQKGGPGRSTGDANIALRHARISGDKAHGTGQLTTVTPPRTAACAACRAVSRLNGKGAAKRIRRSDGKPNPLLVSAPQRTTAEQVAGVIDSSYSFARRHAMT